MEEIKAYRTSDGKVFDDKECAEEHEQEINGLQEIESFCENHMCRDMSYFEIAKVIHEERKELLSILKG